MRACYFCTWGPDSERLHDANEFAVVRRELDGMTSSEHVVTTRHDAEPLVEALDFFCRVAWPAHARGPEDVIRVVVAVGDQTWIADLERAIATPRSFNDGDVEN